MKLGQNTVTPKQCRDALRRFHKETGNVGTGSYRAWSRAHADAPAELTIIRRLGPWPEALKAAGLKAGATPQRKYRRRWTAKQMLGWVREAYHETDGGSYAACSQWLSEHEDAPSGMYIRVTYGTWNNALKAAGLLPKREDRQRA